mmetsp:Transcript_26978/g.43379  ORF Transcript_26978/g.43379 Transcript_26978/m.43379 type:complete len:405 (+) Transcript_26978:692-1906(+)
MCFGFAPKAPNFLPFLMARSDRTIRFIRLGNGVFFDSIAFCSGISLLGTSEVDDDDSDEFIPTPLLLLSGVSFALFERVLTTCDSTFILPHCSPPPFLLSVCAAFSGTSATAKRSAASNCCTSNTAVSTAAKALLAASFSAALVGDLDFWDTATTPCVPSFPSFLRSSFCAFSLSSNDSFRSSTRCILPCTAVVFRLPALSFSPLLPGWSWLVAASESAPIIAKASSSAKAELAAFCSTSFCPAAVSPFSSLHEAAVASPPFCFELVSPLSPPDSSADSSLTLGSFVAVVFLQASGASADKDEAIAALGAVGSETTVVGDGDWPPCPPLPFSGVALAVSVPPVAVFFFRLILKVIEERRLPGDLPSPPSLPSLFLLVSPSAFAAAAGVLLFTFFGAASLSAGRK